MKKCSICDKGATKEYLPFCSQRCQQVDLGRWFSEKYVVSRPALDEIHDQKNNIDDKIDTFEKEN